MLFIKYKLLSLTFLEEFLDMVLNLLMKTKLRDMQPYTYNN